MKNGLKLFLIKVPINQLVITKKNITHGKESEYRAPELTAAFLYSQLTCSNKIQKERKKIFDYYYEKLKKNRF